MKNLIYFSVLLIIFSCQKKEDSISPTLNRPGNFKASKGDYADKIKLSWTGSSKTNNYEVYRFDSIQNDYFKIGAIIDSFYMDTSIRIYNKNYFYKVRIFNSKTEYSDYSVFDYGFISNIALSPTIDKPVNFKASKGDFVDMIALTWSETPKAKNYEVYRFDSLRNDYIKIVVTTHNFYNDTSIKICIQHFNYKIRVYNSGIEYSPYSDFDYGYIAKFEIPLLQVNSSFNENNIQLEWNNILGANKYYIYRSDTLNGNFTLLDSTNSNGYNDQSVFAVKKYYYEIRAFNKSLGMSDYSNVVVGYKLESYSSAASIININEPEGIVCDNNGHLFASSWQDYSIKEYTENGNFIGDLIDNSFSSGLLWLGNNQLAAAKSHDNKIIVYNINDASIVKEWGTSGTGNGQFNYDRRLTIDDDGNFYVTDYLNFRVEKFDNNGNYLTQWSSGSLPWNQDNELFGILYIKNNIIVTSNKNVQFFNTNGTYIKSLDVGAYSIAKDNDGNFYLGSGNILKYNINGDLLAKFGGSELYAPFGISVNNSGDIFVTDEVNNKIYKYTKQK